MISTVVRPAASSARRIAPTRPSIMSDGAMMSQPASASTSACLTSTSTVSSLRISAVVKEPVMAVAGIGIERDIAQEADLGHFLLDGPDGPAHQIVRVECLGAGVVAQCGVGIGKQRDAGNPQLCGALGVAHGLVDRDTLDARHRGDRHPLALAVDEKQRPDQVVGGEHMLAHHPAHPFGAPVASRPTARSSPARAGLSASIGAKRTFDSSGRPNLMAMGTPPEHPF